MAISQRAVGAWAVSNATTQVVTLPTHQAGDVLIVRTIRKPFTSPDNTVINTAGWQQVAAGRANGSTANGNGTGSMGFKAFWKIATSSSEPNPTVTWGTTSAPGAAVAVSYQRGSTESFIAPVGDGGGDATARTSQTSTIATHVSVTSGDLVDFFRGQCDDSGALTVPSITQTGVTFGAVTEYPATALLDGTSNDIAADGGYRIATAGTSSAAAVVTGTSAASEEHGAWMTRLRVVTTQDYTPALINQAAACFAPTITVGSPQSIDFSSSPGEITRVQEIATFSDGAATTTKNIPVSAQPAAGRALLLILVVAGNRTFTVTDTKGNTWTQRSRTNGGTALSTAVWETQQDVGQLTTSDTIDVVISAGTGLGAKAYEYSGALASGWFNRNSELGDGNSGVTAFASGALATTSSDAHFGIGIAAFSAGPGTVTQTGSPGTLVSSGWGPTDFARQVYFYELDNDIADSSPEFSGTYTSARQNTAHILAFHVAAGVAGSFIDQTAATFAPTVSQGSSTQNLTIALLDRTAATFNPTVTSLATIGTLILIDSGAATFAPTITKLNTISLGLINQAAATFAPTVTSTRNLTISLLSQTAATFTPTVTTANAISVGLITQTAATFTPTVTVGAAAVTFGLINQTAATFTPTITTGAVNISLGRIGSPEYSSVVLPNGPVTYLRLGEASGNPRDSSPNHHDVTSVNGSPGYNQTGLLTGDPDGAMSFNGAWLEIAHDADLHQVFSFSIEAWFKRSTTGTADFIWNNGSGDAELYIASNDQIYFGHQDVAVWLHSSTTITDNNRHHLVVAKDNDTYRMFVDGVDVGVFVSDTNPTDSGGATRIGAHTSGSFSFNGTLDDISYYDYALDEFLILAHYQAGITTPTVRTFGPAVTTANTISVGLINQIAATFTPTVTTANAISVALINQTAATFAPTITTQNAVVLGLIDQTAVLFAPTTSTAGGGAQSVTVALLDRTAATFAPVVINAPQWTTPANNTSMSGLAELKFLIPAMPSDMHFHIQLDTAATYDTGNLREVRSDQDQTGWDFWNGSGWVPVPVGGVDESYAGNEARYTVQTALSPASTWYRRVRAGVVE